MKSKSTSAIRVVLVDDHAMVRQGLAHVLQDGKDIQVVGQAGDGLAAIEQVKKQKPDVLVLDYAMPVMDGIAAIAEIRKCSPSTKILVLTVHENYHYAIKALEAGAHGFLIKAAAVQELVQAVHAIHDGKISISPVITEKMAASLREGKQKQFGLSSLSKRELQLLKLLANGVRLQDCAKSMHITDSTASTYRARMLQKLKLNSTAALIRFALENGIQG